MNFLRKTATVAALVLALIHAPSALGQAVSGTITGVVTDPSNAAVAGATITITNVDTLIDTTRETDETGRYVNTNLPPGNYSVAVESTGFQRFVQENVILRVDQTVRVDLILQIGAVTEQVVVSAAPPMLKSEKTDVGSYIPEDQLQALPTFGNNLSKLYNTVPGVIQNFFQIGIGENPSEFNATLVNGQFFGNSEYEVDGITNTAYGFSGFQIIVPNQDSVSELKITTASFDPEFGSSAGMVAQYVTKSGTNELHGSAFWYNRNKFTFAADPFTEKVPGTGPNGTGTGPAPFNWNQFGGSVGGPIVKNKVFWFTDYQGVEATQGAQLTATVPNDAFRRGDFSTWPDNPVFDPNTGVAGGGVGRTPFPSNQIPASRVSPVANNLLALLPQANLSQDTQQNYNAGDSVTTWSRQWDTRVDSSVGESGMAFARYTLAQVFLDNPPLFGAAAGGPAVGGLSPQTGAFRMQHLSTNYTHAFSPTFLTEVRAGFSRFRLDGYQYDAGLSTNSDVGIPNINGDDILTQGLAGIAVGGPVGGWSMGIVQGVGIPRLDRTTTLQLVSNTTWIKGSHQFRFGADVRRTAFDFIAANFSSRGHFNFRNSLTGSQDLDEMGMRSGLGMASFLLGRPDYFSRVKFEDYTKERGWRTSLYWQDTWRINSRLTFNYGARYDFIGPVHPAQPGGIANFDPNTGDILLGGLGDVSRSAGVSPDWNNIAPRGGLAFKLTDKTVIRSGFGRSYFASNYGGLFYAMTNLFPITAQQEERAPNNYVPVFPIEQGPPTSPTLQLPDSGRLKAPEGVLLRYRPDDNATEYIDSWNFFLENQFAQDWKVSLGYVGSAGRKLWWNHDMNAAPASTNPDQASRRPLVQTIGYQSRVSNGCNCANSSYNALQFVVEKRHSKGYSLTSSFTWAKALDGQLGGFGWGDQGLNPHDRKGGYGISPYNRAVVWVLSHSWELPFGKGRRFASNVGGALDAIIGGWQFHGVTTLESGFAFSPTGTTTTHNGGFGNKPDRIGDGRLSNPTRQKWFDFDAFTSGPYGVWGNAGRGILRGPPLLGTDWSFWKEFQIKEDFRVQLRWENFNFVNFTNLGPPVSNVIAPNAGTINGLAGSTSVNPVTVPMRRMQFGLKLVF